MAKKLRKKSKGEIKDLPRKKKSLRSDDLSGVIGGTLPASGGASESTKPHFSDNDYDE
jgi:hypothetical protein